VSRTVGVVGSEMMRNQTEHRTRKTILIQDPLSASSVGGPWLRSKPDNKAAGLLVPANA